VKAWGLCAILLLISGCTGSKPRPVGPAPEYEEPRILPWDAGASRDPLAEAMENAESVDEAPRAEDAGVEAGVAPAHPHAD
jgi:hypothetical protein